MFDKKRTARLCRRNPDSETKIMPFFPMPRRTRTFSGPHATCLQTANTYARRLHRSKADNVASFEIYHRCHPMHGLLRLVLYLSAALFTLAAFVFCGIVFMSEYIFIQLFLRFQYKFTVLLILMGRRRIDFSKINTLIIYYIHFTMLMVGGFGWCSLMFVEL
ncbi:transmembrane protein 250-like [Branchiostoma lanceolatum]|uniref:transmembrane protein 250-like n=1 Tax=Branchiostoma lanceolatum TaxID=7740 RepID=UPI003455BE88